MIIKDFIITGGTNKYKYVTVAAGSRAARSDLMHFGRDSWRRQQYLSRGRFVGPEWVIFRR